MKQLLLVSLLSVGLASCIGDVESARVILSEPEETAVVRVLAKAHRLSINDERMLFNNSEEIMYVPADKQVVFEIVDRGEPTYRLEDKVSTAP
ncbi:MAG: hypothetical protein RL839_16385 [Gammaproteobacteria bacterium]